MHVVLIILTVASVEQLAVVELHLMRLLVAPCLSLRWYLVAVGAHYRSSCAISPASRTGQLDAMLRRLDITCQTSHLISCHGAELHQGSVQVWRIACLGAWMRGLAATTSCPIRRPAHLRDQMPSRRQLSSVTSGEALLHSLKNYEASSVPKDAGTDSPAGFDLVCSVRSTSAVPNDLASRF
jgi:hypothetical protein